MPGQIVELTEEEMDNPGVERWIGSGVLGRVPVVNMTKRLVADKPKILVVVHTLFRGGAEVSTIELHRQLKKFGCKQMLVNIYIGDTESQNMLEKDAREVFDLFASFQVVDRDAVMAIVRDYAMKFIPDIIMYSLLRQVPESLLAIPDRPPCIQVMHSELEDSRYAYHPVATDAVITVSNAMARNMQAELDIPKEHLFTIWNGIDPEKFYDGKSLRRELGIPKNGAIVGMVGSLNDLKRPLVGLEAFAKVRRPMSHMIFAGNPDDMSNAVRARSAELGLEEFVHILGLREDIENVYATLDVLLNCSTMEGLPMTIVEAMFCGVPVIASDVGGNAEAVEHEKTGFVFHPDDHEALASHLDNLLDNYPLRKKMSAAAKKRAEQNFHIEDVASQYLDVLKKHTLSPEHLECSVVMPVYNGERWLDRAIWSVRKQTFPYFEFVIVDDGSTDSSVEIVEKHIERDKRLRLIKVEHGGIVKALNTGILESKCPIIARMDADDEMLLNRLELQLEYMRGNKGIDVLGTQLLGRAADGRDMGPMAQLPLTHKAISDALYHMNALAHPTVMFRKRAWQLAGGYKGDGRCEDYRLWTDMMVAGCRFANMEEALLIYQHTHDGDGEYTDWRDSVLQDIQTQYMERMVV